MITLKNICKSYDHQQVLKNFNYTFEDGHLYLIYGHSGCGKTTLLDILAGFIDYDEGSYEWNHTLIIGKEHQQELSKHIAYLSQFPYFIPYLTIQEHLLLINDNIEEIQSYAKRFHIEQQLQQYPSTLSGGEKQRVAIIQTLLSKKQVLLLDEPTASLDTKNKHELFQLLSEIKNEILIICVTHDQDLLCYADEVIDFHHLSTAYIIDPSPATSKFSVTKTIVKQKLDTFVKKYMTYSGRNRISTRVLFLVFCSFFLFIMGSMDIEDRMVQKYINQYGLNYTRVEIPYTQYEEKIEEIKKEWEIENVVYIYSSGSEYETNNASVNNLQTGIIQSIPTGTAFRYHDHIAYGSYFSEANEVMLGYEKALSYHMDLETMIGKEIIIETPRGQEPFLIRGIFQPFEESDQPYFSIEYQAHALNSQFFFNEKYTNTYQDDEQISKYEKEYNKSKYLIYFKYPYDAYQFSNLNSTDEQIKNPNALSTYSFESYFTHEIYTLKKFSYMLYPFFILMLFLVFAFYSQAKAMELQQNKATLCTYVYYGYDWKTILKSYKKQYRKEISIITLFAFLISILLAFLINLCFHQRYAPFSIKPILILCIAITIALVCHGCMSLLLRSLKKVAWYEQMKGQRDLL